MGRWIINNWWRVRIIFWGTPEYSIASLDIFIKSNHEVIAVVSQPDKKRSRGNKLISSPVKSFAEHESIKIYTPAKIRDNTHFINELKSLSCDLFIVIATGKFYPKRYWKSQNLVVGTHMLHYFQDGVVPLQFNGP